MVRAAEYHSQLAAAGTGSLQCVTDACMQPRACMVQQVSAVDLLHL